MHERAIPRIICGHDVSPVLKIELFPLLQRTDKQQQQQQRRWRRCKCRKWCTLFCEHTTEHASPTQTQLVHPRITPCILPLAPGSCFLVIWRHAWKRDKLTVYKTQHCDSGTCIREYTTLIFDWIFSPSIFKDKYKLRESFVCNIDFNKRAYLNTL